MNKFSIENHAHITLSGVKLDLIINALSDVPSSECFNRLLARNSLVVIPRVCYYTFFCNKLARMVLLRMQEVVYMCSV